MSSYKLAALIGATTILSTPGNAARSDVDCGLPENLSHSGDDFILRVLNQHYFQRSSEMKEDYAM